MAFVSYLPPVPVKNFGIDFTKMRDLFRNVNFSEWWTLCVLSKYAVEITFQIWDL